jgi:hypothetical protein
MESFDTLIANLHAIKRDSLPKTAEVLQSAIDRLISLNIGLDVIIGQVTATAGYAKDGQYGDGGG